MRTKFTLSLILLTVFISSGVRAVTIAGAIWNDKNRNGIPETGEAVGRVPLYVNAIHNGIVLKSVYAEYAMGFGQGKYYISGLPDNTSGVSLVLSRYFATAGSSASLLNTTAPDGYMYTFDNIGGVPESMNGTIPIPASSGTPLSSSNNISNITLGNVQMDNYNFGIIQFPVAGTVNYNLPSQPSVGQVYTFTGAGSLPIIGNGTTVSALKVTQLPTNGVELYYDSGAGLRQARTNGTLAGRELISLNQEIPNFDVSKLMIKLVSSGYSTTTFYYSFRDIHGNLGAPAPYTISWANPLPVKLTKFAVSKENLTTVLSWNTSSEENSDRFEIEHSLDGKKWNNVGLVLAQKNSSKSIDYHYNHLATEGSENIYRLKMIDLDGTFSYSQMKSLHFDSILEVIAYPNPASQTLRVNVSEMNAIKIYDLTGRLVLLPIVSSVIDIKELAEGTYILQVQHKDGNISVEKFMIRK